MKFIKNDELLLRSIYIAPLQGNLLRSAPSPTTAKQYSLEVYKERSGVTPRH